MVVSFPAINIRILSTLLWTWKETIDINRYQKHNITAWSKIQTTYYGYKVYDCFKLTVQTQKDNTSQYFAHRQKETQNSRHTSASFQRARPLNPLFRRNAGINHSCPSVLWRRAQVQSDTHVVYDLEYIEDIKNEHLLSSLKAFSENIALR